MSKWLSPSGLLPWGLARPRAGCTAATPCFKGSIISYRLCVRRWLSPKARGVIGRVAEAARPGCSRTFHRYLEESGLSQNVGPTANHLSPRPRAALSSQATGSSGWVRLTVFRLRYLARGLAMPAIDLAKQLKARFGELLSDPAEFRTEITLNLTDAQRLPEVCSFAKKDLGFDYLTDITSIDNYGTDP